MSHFHTTTKDSLDFIVIGAQKAGTTALFEYLRRHPEVCLPLDKEAPYFSHDSVMKRGWSEYLQRTFPDSDNRCRWGTVTTHYMAGGVLQAGGSAAPTEAYDEFTVPRRIHDACPDVHLIAILRDPVERALSHYRMAFMRGMEQRSFDDAIADLLHPEALLRSRAEPGETASYVTWGEYGRILSAYFEVFPREQLMVAFSDELSGNPAELLKRVYRFIGVDAELLPDNLGARYREGTHSRRLAWLNPDAARRAISRRSGARSLWRKLPAGARRRFDRRFSQIAYRADLWNQMQREDAPDPSAETLVRLAAHFAGDAAVLANLLQAGVPWLPNPAAGPSASAAMTS
jgi:hypothetical protein